LPRNWASETGFPFSSGKVKSGALELVFILHYLYRKSRHSAIAALLAVLLSGFGAAQIRDRTEHPRADEQQSQTQSKKPTKHGPRAIGVIEFLPKGGAQLVPIALWMDGRYYDASLYGADPAPMALQPETLYEAMNYGEPTGWFTVTSPKQVNGNWIADGKWKPQSALDIKMAEQAAKQPKKKASSPINDDSGPPVLRRAPGSGSPEQPSSSSNPSSTPTASGGNSTASSSNAPPPSNDNPDRPTLKNSSPPATTASSRPTLGSDTSPASAQPTAVSTASPDENDPDRPVLQRGKPKPETSANAAATGASKPSTAKTASAAPSTVAMKAPAAASSPPQPGRAYPAISDAGIYETRSLLYPMTPAEKEERGQPMLALATDEIRTYASKRAAAATTARKAPSKTPARPQSFVITDYDLRAFDLDFSNSPTLVLTAKVPVAGAQAAGGGEFDYFVTVVARVDINGQAQKVFSSVTDNNHLDAFPRMEIIDAIDADANGRGDLLFRQYSDTSISYALFRVYPYQMVKVFEGGAGM